MIRRRTFFATVAAVALALLVPVGASSAVGPGQDWVTADRVLVNKLGGVNVSGEFSCAGTYEQLLAGQIQAVRETEEGDEWYGVEAPGATDEVVIFVNSDNYKVTQPAGKRLMIQVEHWSSRMNPCLTTTHEFIDGIVIPETICPTLGGPCRWQTDRFGYNPEPFVPLFDYSSNGKFKAGNLNVEVYDNGVEIVIHRGGTDTWEWNTVPYAADVYFNGIVRATLYR